MINNKSLSIFLFFLTQVLNLNAYGESRKVDNKINSRYKLKKIIPQPQPLKAIYSLHLERYQSQLQVNHYILHLRIKLN